MLHETQLNRQEAVIVEIQDGLVSRPLMLVRSAESFEYVKGKVRRV